MVIEIVLTVVNVLVSGAAIWAYRQRPAPEVVYVPAPTPLLPEVIEEPAHRAAPPVNVPEIGYFSAHFHLSHAGRRFHVHHGAK